METAKKIRCYSQATGTIPRNRVICRLIPHYRLSSAVIGGYLLSKT